MRRLQTNQNDEVKVLTFTGENENDAEFSMSLKVMGCNVCNMYVVTLQS